jgi:predicted MFS family arabinose efflux permease
VIAAVAITGILSHYFGHAGVMVGLAIAALPVIYIHGIWLPRHGVNGWTGEPREKYYALRGRNRPY